MSAESQALSDNVLTQSIELIDPNQLQYVRHIASTLMTSVSLYKWTKSDGSTTLAVKKRLYRGSIPNLQTADMRKEVSILRKVKHENIISVYGVITTEENFALVMEFCLFGSYKSFFVELWRSRQKTSRLDCAISPLKIQNISEVISAMKYLHSFTPKRILHLDLKADNILLDEKLQVKVCDFGLSLMKTLTLIKSTATSFDPLAGTPGRIAPERLRNRRSKASTKDDIFAFGILMWEMVTDLEPYADLDIENALLLEQYIAFNDHRPDTSKIPQFYENGITEMMRNSWAPNPDERPSFEDLYTTIELLKVSIDRFQHKVNEAKKTTKLLYSLAIPTTHHAARSLDFARENLTPDDRLGKRSNSLPVINVCCDEHTPLVPSLAIRKPCMSVTKSLVIFSIVLTLGITTTVLIWRTTDSRSCDALSNPQHGYVNCTKVSGLNKAEKCRFNCTNGYQLYGNGELSCISGSWSDKSPTCERACPLIPPDPYGKTSCSNGSFVNSTCTKICLHNHQVEGNATVRCKPNGSWSSPPPECVCARCWIGETCQFSTRWSEVADAVSDAEPEIPIEVHYGGHNFVCEPGTFAFFHYHSRCSDRVFKEDFNCEGYDSASGATEHAASLLIRKLVEQKHYPEPCDAKNMPTNC